MNEATQTSKALGAELGAQGFDTASLVVDGRESQWSVEEFRSMPLLERVRVLAGGRVRFFRRGAEVPAREALRSL
jgi:hypothetical protein